MEYKVSKFLGCFNHLICEPHSRSCETGSRGTGSISCCTQIHTRSLWLSWRLISNLFSSSLASELPDPPMTAAGSEQHFFFPKDFNTFYIPLFEALRSKITKAENKTRSPGYASARSPYRTTLRSCAGLARLQTCTLCALPVSALAVFPPNPGLPELPVGCRAWGEQRDGVEPQ